MFVMAGPEFTEYTYTRHIQKAEKLKSNIDHTNKALKKNQQSIKYTGKKYSSQSM